MKTSLFIALSILLALAACTKKKAGILYYYDWETIGTQAPSVLPETKYDTLRFKVNKIERTAPFNSPPALPPYNVTMPFDTLIDGTANGEKRQIQTHSKLLKNTLALRFGSTLILSVGKQHKEHVYKIKLYR